MTSVDDLAYSPEFLSRHQIASLPNSFYYIPNFLTSDEQDEILGKLPPSRWVSLSHRRLQVYPSQLTSTNILLDAPLPAWLTASPAIATRFRQLGIFADAPHGAANHCLVNEYKPGEGIMPHEDGAAYHPTVATVSLGGTIALDIYKKRADAGASGERDTAAREEPVARVLQEPGSLLVTAGEAYTALLHGIGAVEEDVGLSAETVANWDLLSETARSGVVRDGGRNVRGTRVSLTFRDVLRVKKIGIGILGRR